MARTRRQTRLYEHTFDVWRKQRNGAKDWVYVLHLSGVKGYFYTTSNADQPTPVGLIKKDIAIMQDKLHYESGEDIKSQDAIVNTTERHPDKGQWFLVTGEPMERPSTSRRSPNYAMAFINKTPKTALRGVA